MNNLKEELHSMYKITEAGIPKLFLDMELEYGLNNEIRLHQRRYINSILKCFGMENYKPVATPLPPQAKLSRDADEHLNTEERAAYKSLIGTLIYLIICCRPDLAYAISVLSKYIDKPTREHLQAAKHVLRYLRGTPNLTLVYKRGNNELVSYSNAD